MSLRPRLRAATDRPHDTSHTASAEFVLDAPRSPGRSRTTGTGATCVTAQTRPPRSTRRPTCARGRERDDDLSQVGDQGRAADRRAADHLGRAAGCARYGSLRGDLVETVAAVADFLRTPTGYALAYLGATADDETTATVRDAFWADRFAKAQVIFGRAAERGEIDDAASAQLAYEALIGTMHFRILARRRPLEPDIAERLVDLIVDGVVHSAGRG